MNQNNVVRLYDVICSRFELINTKSKRVIRMFKTTITVFFLVMMGLVACDVSVQKEQHADAEDKTQLSEKQQEPMATKPVQVNSMKEHESFCEQMNVGTWLGFDDVKEVPVCRQVKSYKLKSFQCDVAKHAFGLDRDAIYIEKDSHRIFAYPTEKICRDALDIRNSNAP